MFVFKVGGQQTVILMMIDTWHQILLGVSIKVIEVTQTMPLGVHGGLLFGIDSIRKK